MAATRRRLDRRAEQAGLGRIVRVHRKYAFGALLIPAVAVVPAGLTTFYWALNESWLWRAPVAAFAVLVLLAVAWTYGGPVAGRQLRIATAEEGVLVSPDPNGDIAAIPWDDVSFSPGTAGPPAVVASLTWPGPDGDDLTIDIPDVGGRADLIQAIGRRRPTRPPSRALRFLAAAVATLTTATVTWFAVIPLTLDLVQGQRPVQTKMLARICDGGDAYGRAAPYSGPAPHPLVVFYGTALTATVGDDRLESLGPGGTVQLVACVSSAGRASETVIRECLYYGGAVRTYQGRSRVEVFEARTGRQVASLTMTGGRERGECQRTYLFNRNKTEVELETSPDDADYRAKLSGLVTGPVR